MNRIVCSLLLVAVLAGCAGAPLLSTDAQTSVAPALAGDPLVARLAEGGFVLYVRHGKTDSTYQDKQDKPEWWKTCDTRGHRPLSDEGRSQILGIGIHMRELRIPIAKVLSSEYCRAVDSALLLQLMPIATDPSLNYVDAQRYMKRNDVQIAAGLRALFSAVPPPHRNVVLVAHVHGFNPPIDPLFSQVQEAETIVLKPLAEGKFEVVGRITFDKWALRAK